MATSTIKQSIQLNNPVLLREITYPSSTNEGDLLTLLISESELNTYKFICLVYGSNDSYSRDQTLISSAIVKATGFTVTLISGVADVGSFNKNYSICVNTNFSSGGVYIRRVYTGQASGGFIRAYGLN